MKQQIFQYQGIADIDAQIMEHIRHSLPICERPYFEVARRLDMGEMALILRIQYLLKQQRVRRFPSRLYQITGKTDGKSQPIMLSHWDKALIHLMRKGLPLSSRPFHIIAKQIDLTVDEVLFRTERLHEWGYIQRVGPGL